MYKITLACCLALFTLRPSPDAQIAFATRVDGNWDIFVMNADGSERRQISQSAAEERFPLWSPDRTQLAFGAQVGGEWKWELWVMAADGSNKKRLVSNIIAKGTRAWSPDGSSIVLAAQLNGDVELLTVRPLDGNITRLTKTAGEDRDPCWSPDGQHIAFTSMREGNAEIYMMRADGTGLRRLTNNSVRDGSPAWSPDGSRIAFVSGPDGDRDMYTVRIAGGEIERLTAGARVTNDVAKWSPDGKQLAIQVAHGKNYDIEIVTPGGKRRRIARSPEYDGQFSWSPDSRRLAYISDGSAAPGVYIIDVVSRRARRLVSGEALNPAWAN